MKIENGYEEKFVNEIIYLHAVKGKTACFPGHFINKQNYDTMNEH